MLPLSRVVAIILAAGASTRLGRPKQLLRWGAETLLDRAVRLAVDAEFTPVVVLGSSAEQILASCDLSRSKVVLNPLWQQGMSSSVRAGVEAAIHMSADAVLLMTCDQPAVTAEHLRRLAEAGEGKGIVASAYAGKKGVPAYFPQSSFAALRDLQGDFGARDLLKNAHAIDLPLGELDVDTDDALQLAKDLLPEG